MIESGGAIYRWEPEKDWFTMDERPSTVIRRRDVLLLVAGSAAAAGGCTGAASGSSARSDAAVRRDHRMPQYQANSPEIQTFYRVNRYPGK